MEIFIGIVIIFAMVIMKYKMRCKSIISALVVSDCKTSIDQRWGHTFLHTSDILLWTKAERFENSCIRELTAMYALEAK